MTLVFVGALPALCSGCASAPIPPTYTEAELKARCESHGGLWRPDAVLRGGFCEYDSHM